MHHEEVKVDLRINRRESGLSQQDLATLLQIDQPRISRLEKGSSKLNITEICKLGVIYNRDLCRLFRLVSYKANAELWDTLRVMSGKSDAPNALGELRQQTLHNLHQRLLANSQADHV